VYDPYFSAHSYGFRPGRSAQQAVEQAAGYVGQGKVWVVDIDLKSFFDEINHERLMSRLSKAISDERLLKLIRLYLKAGLMKDGLESQRLAGTPQGGPLSPLLSNIVLDELDRELEARGLSFVRYADDCNIFVRSRRSAERVMNTLIAFIEVKLKLKVNREKSGVRKCDQVKFLGHTIEENGKIRIADAGTERFMKKIREVTKRNRAMPFMQVIREVNRIIQGWAVYYRRCNTWLSTLRKLDGWIRKRLRCYTLKQHKRKYPTCLFLRKLGVEENYAWHAVMYRSWWSMANYRPVMKAMGIRWFAEQGLRSLVAVQSG
jgi:group II intron reverse transcriptase/maturase